MDINLNIKVDIKGLSQFWYFPVLMTALNMDLFMTLRDTTSSSHRCVHDLVMTSVWQVLTLTALIFHSTYFVVFCLTWRLVFLLNARQSKERGKKMNNYSFISSISISYLKSTLSRERWVVLGTSYSSCSLPQSPWVCWCLASGCCCCTMRESSVSDLRTPHSHHWYIQWQRSCLRTSLRDMNQPEREVWSEEMIHYFPSCDGRHDKRSQIDSIRVIKIFFYMTILHDLSRVYPLLFWKLIHTWE